jgi:protein-S-isoprenylcysteine O-methyltransferase Ste14
MARPGFKQWITRFISPVIERSTYVLVSSVLLAVVLIGWQSVPTPVWTLEGPAAAALWTTFVIGWLVVLSSTFAISHADLFGLRQVYLFWRGSKDHELPFLIRGLYRVVRHPLMLGFIVAFWSAPVMSIGHLLFAVMTTLYILVALQFEERDLLRAFGERYRDYQRRVPMLLPRLMR